MKKIVCSLLLAGMAFLGYVYAETYDGVLDEIIVTISHPKGTEVILASDVRPDFQGMPQTLYRVVVDRLLFAYAASMEQMNLLVTEEEVDEFLEKIMKHQRLSRESLTALFERNDYTYEEARAMMRRTQTSERLMSMQLSNLKNIEVHPDDIQKYYREHPVYTPATYTLQQAFIPSELYDVVERERLIASPELHSNLTWEEPFTLKESEMPADRLQLLAVPVGSIVEQENVQDGIEITRLIGKQEAQLVPFEDRKEDIMKRLNFDRWTQTVADFEKRLLEEKEAIIHFAYDEDKEKVYWWRVRKEAVVEEKNMSIDDVSPEELDKVFNIGPSASHDEEHKEKIKPYEPSVKDPESDVEHSLRQREWEKEVKDVTEAKNGKGISIEQAV